MKNLSVFFLFLLLASPAAAFSPVLPTDNDALFRGQPEEFYMYTDRDFEGVQSRPWQGGTYGFRRNQKRLGSHIIMTRFHEGIDIKPVRRDASGEPLDDVRAIESGRVVHASGEATDSSYGKYVVLQHEVEDAPVYSLYAHLATVDVRPGQSMAQGDRLGRLGYTGTGLNRRRAHLHLEVALLWHDRFETWHAANFPTPNKHGLFNGTNLMGLDVAELYLQQRKNPSLTLPQFIRRKDVFFRLRIPESPHFQLPRRYPWLVKGDPAGARSWIASFTESGFPISLEPSAESIPTPRVEWAKPTRFPYAQLTRSLLDGPARQPHLGPSGQRLVELLTWNPPASSPPEES
ncbi:MAG: M23 family metallopeptidase [Chthoniobacterales bacterium]